MNCVVCLCISFDGSAGRMIENKLFHSQIVVGDIWTASSEFGTYRLCEQ